MSKEDKLFDNLYSKYKDEYSEIFSEYESGTYTKNDIITSVSYTHLTLPTT